MTRCLVPLLLPLFLASSLPAQPVRYEMHRRRVLLERTFAERGIEAVHGEVLRQLGLARSEMIRFAFARACEALDRARHALQSDGPVSGERVYVDSLAVDLDRRLVDAGVRRLGVEIRRLYRRETGIPSGLVLTLSLLASADERARVHAETQVSATPRRIELELPRGLRGDYVLRARFHGGSEDHAPIDQVVSIVPGLAGKLAASRRDLSRMPSRGPDSARATLALWLEGLDRLARRPALDRDVRAAALLERAARTPAIRGGAGPLTPWPGGEARVAFAGRRGSIPCRLFVPEVAAASDAKRAVVVALHGEGGNEDLFFDVHGRGVAKRACRERGWILVAPHGWSFEPEDLPSLIDALVRWHSADRRRVFLIGHSGGAAKALRAAALHPAAVRAVVALSEVVQPAPVESLRALPLLLMVGGEDPAAGRVERFVRVLRQAGHSRLEHRVVRGLAHLLLPAAALPAAFEWLDAVAR